MPISHILEAKQFSRPQIEALLAASAKMEQALKRGQKLNHLSGKVVACLFFEPSTRTRLSFEAAALRLGGQVISMESGLVSSSAFKGESLEDTMRMVQSYADCVVVRHPRAGAVQDMATVAAVPVINAGDGGNQHPTQALLDLYTIKKELGRLHNLNIAFGFDPKHSRTIRSLALLLTHFSGNRFTFVCPKTLKPDADVLRDLKQRGADVAFSDSLKNYRTYDVFYANRLQEERFGSRKEFERLRKQFVITKALAKSGKAAILNPLPRIDEIDPAVDDLPQAAYFRQAQNGLYVRMALMDMLLK